MGHPFEIGGTYRNRDGEYEVVDIDGPDIVIRYRDGRRLETTVKLQARIWKNIQVEEMMGLPRPLDYDETQYVKHPMMDVRIDRRYLAVELLLTDQAWWDAQNFKQKVERHEAERREFIDLLRRLGSDYVFGGWPDSKEPELITTAADLADEKKLLAWLSGLEPGHSWLGWVSGTVTRRIGASRLNESPMRSSVASPNCIRCTSSCSGRRTMTADRLRVGCSTIRIPSDPSSESFQAEW